jgi:hypothetical protein
MTEPVKLDRQTTPTLRAQIESTAAHIAEVQETLRYLNAANHSGNRAVWDQQWEILFSQLKAVQSSEYQSRHLESN